MTIRLTILLALVLVPTAAFGESSERADLERKIDVAVSDSNLDRALLLVNGFLEQNDGDPGMRFRKAQILGWLGELDASAREYRSLRAQYPDNVDYVFGHAQILLRQHEAAPALDDIRLASTLAPDYEDVWRLYYEILSGKPQGSSTDELESIRQHARTHFPDAGWWLLMPQGETPSWTLQAGGSVERLSDGLSGWNARFLQVSYTGPDDHRYFLRGSRDERFGRSDGQLSLGADWQLADDWFAGIAIASSSSPDFLPRSQFDLRAGRAVAEGWVVGASYRRRNYANDRVDSYSTTVERYFGDYRAAWTLGLSDLNSGTRSFGQVLALNWYANDALSIGTSINFGDEAEAVGPGQILETRVRGIALTARYKLNVRLTFDWWLGIQEQGDLYRRQYAGMAVSVGI